MIRSLTIGLPIGNKSQSHIDTVIKRLLQTSSNVFNKAQISPRTIRYTLPPVGTEGETEGHMLSVLRWVDGLATETNVRWFCVPIDFVTEGTRRGRLSAALDIISRFPKSFLNLMVADEEKLSVSAINDVSTLVSRIAKKSNNGFDNFRVGASCGCPANAPFFPFSRHEGEVVGFSFALETTDIALSLATEHGPNLKIDKFRDCLVTKLSLVLSDIHQLGEQISREAGCDYCGLDASFAPFPNGYTSVATLVECLLGAPIGSHGSVFITGLLTDAIRAALQKSGALSVGFNGVMYSLLEDNALASANSRRCISLDGLIALSSMCGCGVDMVPVPGVSFPEEIAAVMLDIAAMSLALKKPLGIRLLPITGRLTNEFTQFNLDFLCDSRVMGLTANDRSLASDANAFGMLAPSRLSRL